jgi:hypothetical protein
MVKSRGASVAKEGLKLTSSNHGFRSESIRISKPNNSKQLVLWVPFFFIAVATWCSPQTIVLRITSYILDHKRFISIPTYSRCLQKALKLHLNPKSSYSAFSF